MAWCGDGGVQGGCSRSTADADGNQRTVLGIVTAGGGCGREFPASSVEHGDGPIRDRAGKRLSHRGEIKVAVGRFGPTADANTEERSRPQSSAWCALEAQVVDILLPIFRARSVL